MVMGRDSHSEGCGFESRYRKLDGHFFTYIFRKNCNDVCLKRSKMNEKEAGVGPFFKKRLAICTSTNHLAQISHQNFCPKVQNWPKKFHNRSESVSLN